MCLPWSISYYFIQFVQIHRIVFGKTHQRFWNKQNINAFKKKALLVLGMYFCLKIFSSKSNEQCRHIHTSLTRLNKTWVFLVWLLRALCVVFQEHLIFILAWGNIRLKSAAAAKSPLFEDWLNFFSIFKRALFLCRVGRKVNHKKLSYG